MYHQAQRFTDSFLDLQKLSKLAPDDAEALEQLQEAARLCLNEMRGNYKVRILRKGCNVFWACCCLMLQPVVQCRVIPRKLYACRTPHEAFSACKVFNIAKSWSIRHLYSAE